MESLATPKNVRAKVLFKLIKQGKVSIEDFPYLSGFRTRVSEISLRYEIQMTAINKNGKNEFGRTFTYVEHHLDVSEVDKAIQVYNTINK